MRLHNIRVVRPPADLDFSDLTAAKLTGSPSWASDEIDCLVMPFDRDLTPAESVRVRRRIVTADADEEARVTSYAEARVALRAAKVTGAMATVLAAVRHLLDDKLAQYGE